MRYRVVPYRQGLEMQGWGIWDEQLSPSLLARDVKPILCSLDGVKPLLFRFMSGAYGWLAECERRGLDLESNSMRVDVYSNGQDGGVTVIHESRSRGERIVSDHPLRRPGD